MKNYTYADEAKVFPRVYSHAMMSLLKRLPLFHYSYLLRNLVEHSQNVTHLVMEDYIMYHVDQYNGLCDLESLQILVAKDVGHEFVDRVVVKYIATFLLSEQALRLSKKA